MFEYASVSASSYDIESLVAKLNERSASGWDVVSVVSTGGEVSAILRRESTGAAMASSSMASSSMAGSSSTSAATVSSIPEVAPAATVIETSAPAVSEPAGWAVEPEPAPAAASYEPTPVATYEPAPTAASYEPASAVSPIEVSTPAATQTVNPTPVVTTPAGWYPDPSGRYEMRYWDGNAWTEHVSRQGQQFTDPPVA